MHPKTQTNKWQTNEESERHLIPMQQYETLSGYWWLLRYRCIYFFALEKKAGLFILCTEKEK